MSFNWYVLHAGPEILKGAPGTHREAAEKVLRQKGVTIVRNKKVGIPTLL